MSNVFKKVLSRLSSVTDHLVEVTNHVVSSRAWFAGTILVTLIFMGLQFFMRHPWDQPQNFFPMTVLLYTLFGLWIENSMKVYQREQSEMQAKQLHVQQQQIELLVGLAQDNKQHGNLLLDLAHDIKDQGETKAATLDALVALAEKDRAQSVLLLDVAKDNKHQLELLTTMQSGLDSVESKNKAALSILGKITENSLELMQKFLKTVEDDSEPNGRRRKSGDTDSK